MGKNTPPQFLHDANRSRQVCILKLRAAGGWLFYGLYNALLEMMRQSPDFRLAHDDVEVMAVDLGVDSTTLRAVVEKACSVSELFQSDGVHFWDVDLIQKMDEFGALRERRSKAGKLGSESRWNSNAIALPSPAIANVSDPVGVANGNAIQNDSSAKQNDGFANITITKPNLTEVRTSEEVQLPPIPECPPPADARYFDVANPDFSTGRFQLKKYPFVWMHQWELDDAFAQYQAASLDMNAWKNAVKSVNAELELKRGDYRVKAGLAYKYLVSHILLVAIEKQTQTNRLTRSRGDTPAPAPRPRTPQKTNSGPNSAPMTGIGEIVAAFGIKNTEEAK